MTSLAIPTTTSVGVIGAGAMGAGIAQVAAAAGHTVRLLDKREDAAAQAIAGIQAQFLKMADKGKMSAQAAAAASARLHPAVALTELADTGLVIEAIVENLEVKRDLFRALEGLCDKHCIFATNTSSISVTAIAAGLVQPERLVGMHFFNPAPLMALVEIISGLATSPALAQCLFDTALAWGKTPVYAKSTPGFIVNRVARPFYGEGLRLLSEGAADCATLDAVLREAGGFRMGPFELMDLIGLDVNLAVTRSVWNAYHNDPRYAPSLFQQALVDAGFLGKKTQRGYYDYAAQATPPTPSTEPACEPPQTITIYGEGYAASALAQRLQAAQHPFTRASATTDERVAVANGVVIFETDGRTATQRAHDSGIPQLVLVDTALEPALATRVALSMALQADARSRHVATGLYQAAGYRVSVIHDVPGMVVMRTVAMLANEAADAVNQGVCDVQGADTAMRLGVNYPRGPLAWADAIGIDKVHAVLKRLSEFYGEDRYRASPLIQQTVFAGRKLYD